MSKYELVNDQFKDRWINKPNNKGDVGDLQDITDELNRLLSERDEAREDVMELQDIKRKHEHEELAAAQENDRLKQERDEAREQNATLRDIAERAIDMLEFNAHSNHGTIVQLRAKLNQLKEGAK